MALPGERPLGCSPSSSEEGLDSNPPFTGSVDGPVTQPWSFASLGIAACLGLMRVLQTFLGSLRSQQRAKRWRRQYKRSRSQWRSSY